MSNNNPNGGIKIPTPPPIEIDPILIPLDPEIEELWSSRALLIVLLLLILSFWVSYYLKVRRIRSIHETIVALFAGMCVGLLVRISPGDVVQNMISFKSTILLNVLLPPIILNSGYQLKQENFFRNFGVILTFAFAGTFISAVGLGVIVYLYSLLGLEGMSLTIVECLLFGSTLSATDPVTILAIFNQLHVDPKLYSVIFGESILNDAVAIVMFETLSQFHGEKISLFSLFHGVGIFLLTFCTSMALGVMFGLACSLMLKHSELSRYTEIESCLVFLIAYTSYFFSNALTMSGIVSLLFCGITLKHYAYHNMSQRTQRTSRYMFGMLAQLSENFIFIYLGLSLFTSTQLVYKPMFILITSIAAVIARYCAVFPISKIINIYFKARGKRSDELPHSYQMMLFWAGLRGAVGVALAAGMKGENAIALRTTVLVTVVLSVVVFGGTIGRMIEILGIRTGVEEEGDGDESDEEDFKEGVYGMMSSGNGMDEERPKKSGSRREVGGGGGGGGKYEMELEDEEDENSPYKDRFSPITTRFPLNANPNRSSSNNNSRRKSSTMIGVGSNQDIYHRSTESQSSSATDSDPDILPTASSTDSQSKSTSSISGVASNLPRVWRDGRWFTVLDERYLLPVFSNATASRRQASKKAMKAQRNSVSAENNQGEGDDYDDGGDGSPGQSEPSSPYLDPGHNRTRDFKGSFSDILSSLVTSPIQTGISSSNTSSPLSGNHKKRNDSDDVATTIGGGGGGNRSSSTSRNDSPNNSNNNNRSSPTMTLDLNLSSAGSRSGTASPRRTGGSTPKLTSVGLSATNSSEGSLLEFDGR